ncbi:MAG: dihydroorotate dehydrogenase [Dehalococcoidales bacterium]|nr:dihydroorotate dehydrogenase [Dehalococcoidales bacterium]
MSRGWAYAIAPDCPPPVLWPRSSASGSSSIQRVRLLNCLKEVPTNLSVELAPGHPTGLLLANPVMTASGTFGYGTEYSHLFDIQKLGAIVSKGTTLEPREGNPQPRIAETACGVLNAIGLQNIGAEALIRDKAPVWAGWQVPVIVNIAGETVDEYARLAGLLNGVTGISALEVNISCPNVKAGGAEFGTTPESAARVTAAVKAATSLPVLVKLTPNTADIRRVAAAVARAGADAISLINTIKGMTIDITRRKPLLGNISGGLSGPAVKPVALYMVYEVAGAVEIPVIGCGGITTANDAIEFLIAGASAVQVGTASLSEPQAPFRVLEGIEEFMTREGISDITELIGAARSKPR